MFSSLYINSFCLVLSNKGKSPHQFLHECLYGAVVNVLDSDIVTNEFELHSCYYVHFQTITFGEGMTPPLITHPQLLVK